MKSYKEEFDRLKTMIESMTKSPRLYTHSIKNSIPLVVCLMVFGFLIQEQLIT